MGGGHEGAARSAATDTVAIPGPMRSFLRMAGVSQEVSLDEVIPMLARNASLHGYQFGKETEYLALVNRYVHLARELQQVTDSTGTIHASSCEDAGHLVQVLGYRFQRPCGQGSVALVTADAERAFLTSDSGFPLTGLEESLEKKTPFSYVFPGTQVPIYFREKDWTAVTPGKKEQGSNLVDALLHDQDLDRLYWAFAKVDTETRNALRQAPGMRKLYSLAAVFELYGSGIRVHSGHIVVPAGSEKEWEELVGASVNSPGEFVNHLLTRDRGWLAAYFDAVSRLDEKQQAHLSENDRLKRLYDAYRSTTPRTNAAFGVFPRNAEVLILLASVRWNANGEPEIPASDGFWQSLFSKDKRDLHEWADHSRCCQSREHLLEALVAASNLDSDSGPMQVYLMLSALDEARTKDRQLSEASEKLIADRLSQFSRWFSIFAEFPALDDNSIARFINAADRIDGISNPTLRANALGAFQADLGLWQILARQGETPADKLNASWQNTVQPFLGVSSSMQLFEAARTSLQAMLTAAGGKANATQDEVVDLLAGPPQATRDGQRVHNELSDRIHGVLDDQRLVSLDTLFALYDGLNEMAHGADVGKNLLPLAGNLREFEMPRPIFTGSERSSWAPVVYTSRHAELQVRTDLTRILQSHPNASQLDGARGQLTPFLRDTLVGLNYAYYEPPGAEVLHNNPLFVRSHDFSSISVIGVERIWGEPDLIGVGATAGGGAYLMGSLADLPYALASTEEDFIAPRNIQALIWKEAVPELLVSAVVPRWWSVSHEELHAAALYQRTGEELLTESATDTKLRGEVLGILADRLTPGTVERAEEELETPKGASALAAQVVPAKTFYLAVEFRQKYPDQALQWGTAGRELDELVHKNPAETSADRIARDFGVPHPALTLTDSCSLLNMKPMPAFGGPASRLFAESWESNNLYWARLADEMGYSPAMLNILVPTLTRRMVANIFASNIEDWPALFRAMQETGDEFREGKIAVAGTTTVARE